VKIVASYSIKGGVGKTALSVNLAYAFAVAGRRTLLVDLDPQGASAFYYRVKPAKKVTFEKPRLLRNRLRKNIRESDYPNLDVLPSNLAYRNFDIMLDRMKKSRGQLRRLLSLLGRDYDVIVLDCPPNITLLSENVFRAADMILVPVIPTPLSQRTFEQLRRFFKDEGLPRKRLVPFFSMAQTRNRLHRDVIADMSDRYPTFLDTVIPFSVDVERMGLRREPVLAYASRKSAVQAYHRLCDEILEKLD
jgi:chromosome partitioning protein